ncbi:hypothetical protein SAMN04488057_114103 [Cyclobacterium lianum]|uniref:Phytanoyl-CoA dioxygenase (PhyH) n=1 Tax=Cyclobacterium lianum TaxID=388280 RepID=A0A1M7Q6T8_9BACT|nr:phytanoyl-CoA dioxygenase [Cyclobacterium lianum]SHN26114.1 hypothetical protein SAMN04488057_114103 [Cyclobacterium lianum]
MRTVLSQEAISQFIQEGFLCLPDAFPDETARAVRKILWEGLPCDKNNPATWTAPVIRLGMYSDWPFIDSVNSPYLYSVFDELVGQDKWIPCRSVGTFPVRFPSAVPPNDVGKHVDASFPGKDPGNVFEWRINARSRGRALLMLVLYSDVGENDAPTIIYKGSHIDVAKILLQKDDSGLSFLELANRLEELPPREKLFATGQAGTIYLCHPFLVHAAQAHSGINPRFMAQPPLLLKEEFSLSGTACSPVEQAIQLAAG